LKVTDMRTEGWVPGVPDDLVLKCPYCNVIPSIGFTVTDDSWKKIIPVEHSLGVVCLPCFNIKAKEKGIMLHECLEEVWLCDGRGETIRLIPVDSYLYDVRS